MFPVAPSLKSKLSTQKSTLRPDTANQTGPKVHRHGAGLAGDGSSVGCNPKRSTARKKKLSKKGRGTHAVVAKGGSEGALSRVTALTPTGSEPLTSSLTSYPPPWPDSSSRYPSGLPSLVRSSAARVTRSASGSGCDGYGESSSSGARALVCCPMANRCAGDAPLAFCSRDVIQRIAAVPVPARNTNNGN